MRIAQPERLPHVSEELCMMKQGLGKFAMAMTAIFILADSANSEPVYNPLHFEFSEICQEGQDVLECTDRLMRMADNLRAPRKIALTAPLG